jgi:hypothetical protein
MMRSGSTQVCHIINNTRCFELLPILAEGRKKYVQIAPKYCLERLVRNLDRFLERLETKLDMEKGPPML